ncbi:MAG: rhamnogalacturonan acetylesterase [Mangrovibacterium sp.]
MKLSNIALACAIPFLVSCEEKIEPDGMHFDFGAGKVENGYTGIDSNSLYCDSLDYGIIPFVKVSSTGDLKGKTSAADALSSEGAFYFKRKVEDGAYKVCITFGSNERETEVTVKAEARRLFVHDLKLAKGEFKTVEFIVDVFTRNIPNSEKGIILKEREKPSFNWDEYLTIEFNGKAVNVASLVIEKKDGLRRLFIAGDSTVTDQDSEPWASWGQMFPYFMNNDITVANYAVSGSTLRHYRGSRRLDKTLTLMNEGDYMIIEFAHNDQKKKGYEAYGDYTVDMKDYCDKIIAKGGQPILITSTMRRRFDENDKVYNTLGDFPQAMRDYAKNNNIPLVDLNQMSVELYEALGEEESKKALVHYPAGTFLGQTKGFADNTHFNTYGAYELAMYCGFDESTKFGHCQVYQSGF